ncbi:MAG: hypothetical protein IKV81_06225 [Clostridia bacterium]|nr:hypothetical protein [Clostridia bacterium]
MKLTKKLIALVIVCVMALAITGCHKQNEIAVTVNGYEFTSGYYMCALVNAYLEGQSAVYESKEDTTSEINYFKEKIDDKEFSVWVKDRAIDLLEEIGTYKKLCDDKKIKIDDETKANAENTAYYMWSMYGYGALFEPNGVSYETYKKFTLDSYCQTLYFEHLYGEKGEKEIAAADVEKKLYDNFIIADLIDVTFSEETAEKKAETKTKLEGYLNDLTSKKKTFEEVYKLHNNITEEEKEEEKTENEDVEILEPLDEYAQILGAKDSGYDHDYFSDINKMATNEVKLITKKDNAGYLLVVKKDIKADPYYRDSLDMTVRHLLKDADFEKDMEKLFKEAKADINSYAVDRFKVKNIKEPSYS